MKEASIFCIITVLFLSVAGNLHAGEKISMAVYDFNANQIESVVADSADDFVQTELFSTGRFTMVERKNIGKILKEQAFQHTGCTSTECAVEVGRILIAREQQL